MLGPDASFRPGQLEAIEAVARDRGRVLLVQRTGWGKSAVYFIATKLLREQGAGPTLLVSPLLALMRNQIEMAARIGVRAETINSTNPDEFEPIVQRLADDQIDLLLVSPERFANERFRDEMLSVIARTVGLLVVDEAHCISDWGHDFRPDYRRIVRVLEALPADVPVLCTTATANDRVIADITDQLGSSLRTYRGTLDRESLALAVADVPSQAERMAWLAETIPTLDGSGIVYVLTIADGERVAAFLRRQGIEAEAYSGATDNDDRIRLEQALLANELKVLVATSALGMGFDKPDLGFVIHYQSPGSPIAYYQQVGRAGRALDHAPAVLLCGVEDREIQDYFIETAFPPQEQAEAIVSLVGRRRRADVAERTDGGGERPPRPARVDAEGARGGGRRRARARRVRAHRRRVDLPDRAHRAHHRAAPARAGGDAPVRAPRRLPDGVPAPRARRPGRGTVRAVHVVHGDAAGRGSAAGAAGGRARAPARVRPVRGTAEAVAVGAGGVRVAEGPDRRGGAAAGGPGAVGDGRRRLGTAGGDRTVRGRVLRRRAGGGERRADPRAVGAGAGARRG